MSPSNICIFCTKIKAFFMCHFFVNPNPDTKVKKNLQETNKTRKKTSTREETKKFTLRRKEFLLGLSRKSISLFEVGSPVPQSVLTSFFFRKIGRCETLFALTPRDHVVGHRWCNGKLRCIFLLSSFDSLWFVFRFVLSLDWKCVKWIMFVMFFFLWSLLTEISTKGFVSSRSRGGNSWNH